MSMKWLLIGLITAAVVPAHAAGKTYRWVDTNGRPHFSDVPAPKSERIEVKPGSGLLGDKEKSAVSNRTVRASECQRKREQLITYTSAAQVSETDAIGNVHTYTDAEKDKLVARTQLQVRDACGQG